MKLSGPPAYPPPHATPEYIARSARKWQRIRERSSWIAHVVLLLCALRDVTVDDVIHELERFRESTTLVAELDREVKP